MVQPARFHAAGCAFALNGLGPHLPFVAFHDSLADGQPEPGSGVFVLVKALEETKDAHRMLRLKADAVVLHRDDPHVAFQPRGDTNLWRGIRFSIFQGVR